jgi:GNAT superfamily N-acetyltransferase
VTRDTARDGLAVYVIRVATPDDLATVLRHRRRMFEDMGYTDPAALQAMLSASGPLLAEGLAGGSYRGWLAQTPDGHVVAGGGIIRLTFQSHPNDPRPERAWVVNMFTEPAHRRRGLARRLLARMVAYCQGAGMRSIYLHASDSGRALYEHFGFAPTNEMRLDIA